MMMNVWGMTDVGLTRRENQDAYAVHTDQESGFTVGVVCDGMGGPGGGKLASELAVETFMSVCLDKLSPEMDLEGAKQVAESAVAAATRPIFGRLVRSRSPPQPNRATVRPLAKPLTVDSTFSRLSGLWA